MGVSFILGSCLLFCVKCPEPQTSCALLLSAHMTLLKAQTNRDSISSNLSMGLVRKPDYVEGSPAPKWKKIKRNYTVLTPRRASGVRWGFHPHQSSCFYVALQKPVIWHHVFIEMRISPQLFQNPCEQSCIIRILHSLPQKLFLS